MSTANADTPESGFTFSERARRTVEQPIGYLMAQAVENPSLISFAAGLVDYATLPSEELAELSAKILRGDGIDVKTPLQYGTTEGLTELRRRMLERSERLDGLEAGGYGVGLEDVIVTTGSQQLLYILTDILVDPGDIVLCSWPSYFVYTSALKTMGAEVRCVDIDQDGMVPEALEDLLEQLESQGKLARVKIVYVVDYHQNPTGITLSEERRPKILDLVRSFSREHRILLLEDSAYRELTYEGKAPRTIKSFESENRYCALAQSFSKSFSPGMKTGYGILPSDLVAPILLQKGSHDFGSANLCQHLLLAALESGLYERHVEELCRHYSHKRDALLGCLESRLGDLRSRGLSWTRPTGGMYVWLSLPEGVDTRFDSPLFERALKEGVIYVPGSCCYPDDPTRTAPVHEMRLSFGEASIENIERGIELLAKAVRATLGG